MASSNRSRLFGILLLGACVGSPVWAGNVQVQVMGSNGKPLADAVVFLESPAARAAVKPQTGLEIPQVAKEFVPMVSVVSVGSQVLFPNRDKVRHHVYSFSPAKTFELKLYSGSPSNPVLFDKTGVVVLGCNIHDSMTAWILVVDTPYAGRTDAGGRLSLGNVPNGNYQLRSWHSTLAVGAAAQEQTLHVEGADTRVSVTLSGTKP